MPSGTIWSWLPASTVSRACSAGPLWAWCPLVPSRPSQRVAASRTWMFVALRSSPSLASHSAPAGLSTRHCSVSVLFSPSPGRGPGSLSCWLHISVLSVSRLCFHCCSEFSLFVPVLLRYIAAPILTPGLSCSWLLCALLTEENMYIT